MRTPKIFLVFIFLVLGVLIFPNLARNSGQNPVIIVPGIMASWNWDTMMGKIFGDSWGFFPGVHVYNPLIKALEDAGYEKGKDLFIAYYDWRKSNEETAFSFLKQKIDEAKTISGKTKVDLIAHSMGGLVSRAYVQSNSYGNDVEHLIMLGTPNHGSSDVYSVWEGGVVPKNWGIGYKAGIDFYLWYFTIVLHNSLSRYDIIHQYVPSVGEMMPIYTFIQQKETDGSISVVPYENMQVKNPFLENLYLTEGELYLRVHTANIFGNDEATVGAIQVEPQAFGSTVWQDGKPDPFPPPRNDSQGDNRVLRDSAAILTLGAIPVPDPNNDPYPGFIELGNFFEGGYSTTKHNDLPERSLKEIFYILGQPDPQITPTYSEPANTLDFFFTENVNVKIISPSGKYIDNSTSTISGAELETPPDPLGPKIFSIPNPEKGQYQVEIEGLANEDDLHFAAYFASGSNRQIENFSGSINQGETQTYEVDVDSDAETPIDSQDGLSLEGLIQDVKDYYRQDKIQNTENCENPEVAYAKIKEDYFSNIWHLKMGRIEENTQSCLKLETAIETDDNQYQGMNSRYDVTINAYQIGSSDY